MSNLNNTPQLFICRIDKHGVDENSLISILEQDNDFSENEDYFRIDTLELGFENEAERVSKEIFEKIDIESNSDDFIFDNQMLAQIFYAGFEIGEITCPTKYFEEASSINFKRSVQYGLGVIGVSISYRMARWGIVKPKLFYPKK